MPGFGDLPELWLLGSSGYSAQVAAALGIPFAFAHHFAGENTEAALDLYRERFTPSTFLSEPHTMVPVNVVALDDPAEVRRQILPSMISFLGMRRGLKPVPVSIAEAESHEFSDFEEEFIAERLSRQAVGTPDEVAARLERLLASTGADELMVASQAADLDARVASLAAVARLASPVAA